MNTLKLTDSELEILKTFYEIGMNTITKDYYESGFDPKTSHQFRQNITLTMLKDHDVEINKDVVWLKIWNLLDPEGEFAEPPDDWDENTAFDVGEFMP